MGLETWRSALLKSSVPFLRVYGDLAYCKCRIRLDTQNKTGGSAEDADQQWHSPLSGEKGPE
jgi:hypothetical protein